MHFLIVGLGNPGGEYQGTRHNVGFEVLDSISSVEFSDCWQLHAQSSPKAQLVNFRTKGRAEVFEARAGTEALTLLKPQTYMNLSGEAVSEYARFFKIAASALVVVHDELDLPLGTMRIKQGGGDAGHNGLKSVTQLMGSANYIRLRLGIGRPPSADLLGGGRDVSSWVLGRFASSERSLVQNYASRAREALNVLLADGCSLGAIAKASKALAAIS